MELRSGGQCVARAGRCGFLLPRTHHCYRGRCGCGWASRCGAGAGVLWTCHCHCRCHCRHHSLRVVWHRHATIGRAPGVCEVRTRRLCQGARGCHWTSCGQTPRACPTTTSHGVRTCCHRRATLDCAAMRGQAWTRPVTARPSRARRKGLPMAVVETTATCCPCSAPPPIGFAESGWASCHVSRGDGWSFEGAGRWLSHRRWPWQLLTWSSSSCLHMRKQVDEWRARG